MSFIERLGWYPFIYLLNLPDKYSKYVVFVAHLYITQKCLFFYYSPQGKGTFVSLSTQRNWCRIFFKKTDLDFTSLCLLPSLSEHRWPTTLAVLPTFATVQIVMTGSEGELELRLGEKRRNRKEKGRLGSPGGVSGPAATTATMQRETIFLFQLGTERCSCLIPPHRTLRMGESSLKDFLIMRTLLPAPGPGVHLHGLLTWTGGYMPKLMVHLTAQPI